MTQSNVYAIYLRKSRVDEEAEARGEGETLARHEHALLELARRRNLPIAHIYREIVSGESVANRPQMQRLLADVSESKYAGVLCMELERLARGDPMDQARVSRTFKFSGTQIITPIKTYQPDDSIDEEFVEFSLFMSRREYKTIVRRLQTGRKLASTEGRYIASRAPYGYDRVQLPSKEWTLKPNDDEAPVVRQIFEWYSSGLGGARIATLLNNAGIKTKRQGIWHQATIATMLKNPIYIGRIKWDKRIQKTVGLDESGRSIYKRISNNNSIDVAGLHPPIVSEELFAAVNSQQCVQNKPPVRSDLTLVNPLSKLVYCACCGAPLHGTAGSKRPDGKSRYPYRLRCPRVGCENYGAAINIIEDAILDTLESWQVQYRNYKPAPKQDSKAETIEMLERQLKQIAMQRDRLCDLLERGIYDEATFQARSVTLAEQQTSISAQLAELRKSLTVADPETLIANIVDKIPSVLSAYRTTDDAETKNHLLCQVIERVDYKKLKRCNNRENVSDYIEITVYPFATS